ncbi:MAG: hypothetical protein IPK68_07070 [Bdellovibrionales bacterium]|nr:hypothetical protein [Bdellovibrionales bacterium]
MRNDDGTFSRGNKYAAGHGRPEGAGKSHLKEMCWASVEKIARLVFQMPEAEMKLWVDQNKNTLSLAERLYIDEAQNIAVIESLLDRIVGKTLKIEGDIVERDSLIERLHTISPESLEAEIDELIRNREIIKK